MEQVNLGSIESALRLSGSFLFIIFLMIISELWGRSINNIPINSIQNLKISAQKLKRFF